MRIIVPKLLLSVPKGAWASDNRRREAQAASAWLVSRSKRPGVARLMRASDVSPIPCPREARFTVLQYDADGNEIAINELDGIAGDNYWTWKQKTHSIYTRPDAATIRIRFGLISSTESYLDVDALK